MHHLSTICWHVSDWIQVIKNIAVPKIPTRQKHLTLVHRVHAWSCEVLSWADMSSSSFPLHQNSSLLYYRLCCCHSDKLATATVLQELEFVPSVWNNFLSGVYSTSPDVLWDSRPLRLSTVCHFLPRIRRLVISLPIVLARQWPTWSQLVFLHSCFMALWLCHSQHKFSTVKTLFCVLFFFLSHLTFGKLNRSRIHFNRIPRLIWQPKADSPYPKIIQSCSHVWCWLNY